MGADIHFYVEVKTEDEWVPVAPLEYDVEADPDFPIPYMATAYDGRDYVLFAALSGVRIEDIDAPDTWPLFEAHDEDSFPEGVSPQIEELWSWAVDNGIPAHSATMATLTELQSVDWTFLDEPQYRADPVALKLPGGKTAVIAGDEGREGALERWQRTLQYMATLGTPESVRAVWWFDN